MRWTPLPSELKDVPAFSRGTALASGLDDRRLRHRSAERVTHGWYTPGLDPSNLTQRCRGIREALPPDAVFSDATAALLHQLPVPHPFTQPLPIQITIPPRPTAPRRRGLVVHRRHLTAGELSLVDGLPVTSPERTFVDLAMALPREELVAVGDALLRTTLASARSLSAAIAQVHRRRGLVLARSVLPLLDARSQSRPESLLRIRLADADLPAQPQCPVVAGSGSVIGHADLGFANARVAIEYEGRHHAEGAQFAYDIERYSAFAAAGWLVLRAGPHDLRERSALLIARVRAALHECNRR